MSNVRCPDCGALTVERTDGRGVLYWECRAHGILAPMPAEQPHIKNDRRPLLDADICDAIRGGASYIDVQQQFRIGPTRILRALIEAGMRRRAPRRRVA